MKLKKVVSVALVAALSVGLLAGCGGGKDDKDMTITVAASPSPHAEILAVAAEVLAEEGYTLEIEEFTDYVVPNTVVEEGEDYLTVQIEDGNQVTMINYDLDEAIETVIGIDETTEIIG